MLKLTGSYWIWTPRFQDYKNAEAAKILPTDTSNIDPKTKDWFDEACI
jgi:hypothetical protein